MGRFRSALLPVLVAIGLSHPSAYCFAGDFTVCHFPGGITSEDPARNRSLMVLQETGKKAVGPEVTEASRARIYLTVSDGELFAATNFRPVCPSYARAKFRGFLDRENRFTTPTKLLTDDPSWTPQRIAREFLLSDYSAPEFRDNITFLIDEKFLIDPFFGRMGFGAAKRVNVIDRSGHVWPRDAYDLVSGNSELKRWAKLLGARDGAKIKQVSQLIGDNDFIKVAARFNPSSVSELASLKETLKDVGLVRAAERLRISSTRDLDGLRGELDRYRAPELRKASVFDKSVTLRDGNSGAVTNVSDMFKELRSGQSLPTEWTAWGEKVVLIDVADLSAADTLKVAGKVLGLVAEASPDGGGPVLVFTKDPARARQRLTGFIDYREVEFHNDERSLVMVREFGPMAKEILDGLNAGDSDGPHFRFVIGHLDRDAAVLGRLIADAKAGKFRGVHLGVGVCNDPKNWVKFMELYDAAMENGTLSVTFPMQGINIPALTLVAVTLKANPSLLRLNSPQAAVREGYREAHRLLLDAAGTTKSEPERRLAIRRAFGEKAVEFFLIGGKLNQPRINEVLNRLATDGVRMVPFADISSPTLGSATASMLPDDRGDTRCPALI